MAIGQVWSKVALCWAGNAEGRHCHWCAKIIREDGESHCLTPGAIYGDGERIRSWDGEGAVECPKFELDPWYEDDGNVDKYFTPEAAASWKE